MRLITITCEQSKLCTRMCSIRVVDPLCSGAISCHLLDLFFSQAPVQTIHTTIYSITPQQIPADFVQNLTLNLSSGPAPHRYMVTSAAARQLDGNVEIVVHLMPVLEEAGGPGNPVQALDQSATIMANAPSQL